MLKILLFLRIILSKIVYFLLTIYKNEIMGNAKCIIIPILLLLIGCDNVDLKTIDFVGVWKSEDNSIIQLNEDGTCILSNLDKSIVSISKNENDKLTTIGTWKLTEGIDNGLISGIDKGIKITYNLMDREGKGGIVFHISGQGFNESTPPWDIFIWNGDPDEMIKYKFVKQP